MKRLLFPILLISLLVVACEKYTYTPLYPTPVGSYYENISMGTVYNGNLIVVGNFSHLFNATGIAQWNGTSWQILGSGVSNHAAGGVNAFTIYNGNLIVGGSFTVAGGLLANGIAQWNGSSWQTISGGVTVAYGYNNNAAITSLVVYNGNLVVAGSFEFAGSVHSNNIAQWNGTSWLTVGSKGTDTAYYGSTSISALTVYNGNLVAGGRFSSIGGTYVNCLAQWNGTSWSGVGSKCNGDIFSLFVFNGNLVATGGFDTIGGVAAKGIAQWNGISWSALNQLGSPVYGFTPSSPTIYNGVLYFNYGYDSTLYQWNGSGSPVAVTKCSSTKERWNNPNASPFMQALCVYNGNLVVGGWFTSVNGVKTDSNLAQWNGSTWLHL